MALKFLTAFLRSLALASVVSAAAADTLILRTGERLEGTFVGASGDILYLRAEGEIKQFSIDQVASIRFDQEREARRGTDPGEQDGSRAVIVGAGALITVAFSEKLLTGNLKEGQIFRTRLSKHFKSGDTLLAPAGNDVYGKIVQRDSGGAGLVLTEMVVAGERVPIRTEPRDLPATGEPLDRVDFRVERPFTLRVAVTR